MNDVPSGALTVAPSRWSMMFVNSLMAPVDSQYSISMSQFIYETQVISYLSDDLRYPPVFWLTGLVSAGTGFTDMSHSKIRLRSVCGLDFVP